jgi:fatty acid desaturase
MKGGIAVATLGGALALAAMAPHPAVVVAAAVLFGFASTQVALLAHDTGHVQAFRGRRLNALARLVFGNLLLGVSHSWWVDKHNRHHAMPNHVDADPDIQFPVIVFSEDEILSRPRWAHPLIAVQAFVLPVLIPFQAVMMRVSSIAHLVQGKSRRPVLEAAFLSGHVAMIALVLALVGSWPMALTFVLVGQAVFGTYNSSVFATNHKGMPLIRDGGRLGFLHEQVLTSRNVRGGRFVDFWFGGLNYQIEHHLFPSMPRNRLREARTIVHEFCAEHGIPYHETGALASYREVFSHLHRVSAVLRGRPALARP